MRALHIVLVNHGITKRRINFAMPQQYLHLLNGHSLVDCLCCQSSPEFVRMNTLQPSAIAKFSQPRLYPANPQTPKGLVQ